MISGELAARPDLVVRHSPLAASLPPGADGSITIAHLDTSAVHRIDTSGAVVWLAIDGERSIDEIVRTLAAEHDLQPSTDMLDGCVRFVADLIGRGLLERVES